MTGRYVDMHCDTITALYQRKQENQSGDDLQLTISKMQQAGYLLQNFAIFLSKNKVDNLFEQMCLRILFFQKEMEKNAHRIKQIFTYDEIEKNNKKGKMNALLTLEGGELLEGKMENLYYVHELGVRMITLTWNFSNELGFPNFDMEAFQRSGKKHPDFTKVDRKRGLTKKGIEMIEEMERLSIIPDVSHGSDALFMDVLRHTKKPFVASHSNAREVYPHCRNLSDDMIKKLAERGGVIGMNFCADFVSDRCSRDQICYAQDIVRHMQHIKKIGGIECIGLGSDFDGIENEVEWKDASGMEYLHEAMKKSGFTQRECDMIFRDNVLRVYKDCFSKGGI